MDSIQRRTYDHIHYGTPIHNSNYAVSADMLARDYVEDRIESYAYMEARVPTRTLRFVWKS